MTCRHLARIIPGRRVGDRRLVGNFAGNHFTIERMNSMLYS
jgi:hypothetical protein